MPTHDELYAFLRTHYKHERFEGRNDPSWFADYSHVVTRSAMDYLKRHGFGIISRHEAARGEAIYYDTNLQEMDKDARQRAVRGER